jgi:hypothetical protein
VILRPDSVSSAPTVYCHESSRTPGNWALHWTAAAHDALSDRVGDRSRGPVRSTTQLRASQLGRLICSM